MNILKSSSIALVAAIAIFGSANINLDYKNCMKATKHSYISKIAIYLKQAQTIYLQYVKLL